MRFYLLLSGLCRTMDCYDMRHADTVEGLFEVYKVDVQSGLPLDTLLHNNSQCRYLVHTALTTSKPRLLLSQLFVQCHFNAFQNHSSEHFTCHVQRHNATLVFAVAQITFLWQLDYQTLLPFIRYLPFAPCVVAQVQENLL